jgi:beta-lactamase class C
MLWKLVLSLLLFDSVSASVSVDDIYCGIKNNISKNNVNGGAFVILQNDKILYKEVFGKIKCDGKVKNNTNTIFPLASVSKTITAIVIGTLIQQGKLDFDEKFKLPYLKNEVTLKEILSHTTGYNFGGNVEIEKGFLRHEILHILSDKKPICNKCHIYNNIVFSVIEDILAQKNISFRDEVIKFNQMLNHGYLGYPKYDNNTAYFNKVQDGICHSKMTSLYIDKVFPSAGFYASIDAFEEILKLMLGMRVDLISKNILNDLYNPIAKTSVKWRKMNISDSIDQRYGLGIRIFQNHKNMLIFHSGYLDGGTAFIGIIPEKRIGIAIVFNDNKMQYDIINMMMNL